jgi:hypothetical protein
VETSGSRIGSTEDPQVYDSMIISSRIPTEFETDIILQRDAAKSASNFTNSCPGAFAAPLIRWLFVKSNARATRRKPSQISHSIHLVINNLSSKWTTIRPAVCNAASCFTRVLLSESLSRRIKERKEMRRLLT